MHFGEVNRNVIKIHVDQCVKLCAFNSAPDTILLINFIYIEFIIIIKCTFINTPCDGIYFNENIYILHLLLFTFDMAITFKRLSECFWIFSTIIGRIKIPGGFTKISRWQGCKKKPHSNRNFQTAASGTSCSLADNKKKTHIFKDTFTSSPKCIRLSIWTIRNGQLRRVRLSVSCGLMKTATVFYG